jgi:hypothetical protein
MASCETCGAPLPPEFEAQSQWQVIQGVTGGHSWFICSQCWQDVIYALFDIKSKKANGGNKWPHSGKTTIKNRIWASIARFFQRNRTI